MKTLPPDTLIDFVSDDLLMREPDQKIAIDEELLLSGLLESIAIMRLVAFVENASGISIPPENVTLENFASVEAILSFLDQRSEAG